MVILIGAWAPLVRARSRRRQRISSISYWLPGSGAATQCGSYSVASSAFMPVSGYTQATCLLPGTTIRVHASYDYAFITPMLKATFGSVAVVVDASALEEA